MHPVGPASRPRFSSLAHLLSCARVRPWPPCEPSPWPCLWASRSCSRLPPSQTTQVGLLRNLPRLPAAPRAHPTHNPTRAACAAPAVAGRRAAAHLPLRNRPPCLPPGSCCPPPLSPLLRRRQLLHRRLLLGGGLRVAGRHLPPPHRRLVPGPGHDGHLPAALHARRLHYPAAPHPPAPRAGLPAQRQRHLQARGDERRAGRPAHAASCRHPAPHLVLFCCVLCIHLPAAELDADLLCCSVLCCAALAPRSVVYNNNSFTGAVPNTKLDVGPGGYAIFPTGRSQLDSHQDCLGAERLARGGRGGGGMTRARC